MRHHNQSSYRRPEASCPEYFLCRCSETLGSQGRCFGLQSTAVNAHFQRIRSCYGSLVRLRVVSEFCASASGFALAVPDCNRGRLIVDVQTDSLCILNVLNHQLGTLTRTALSRFRERARPSLRTETRFHRSKSQSATPPPLRKQTQPNSFGPSHIPLIVHINFPRHLFTTSR